MQKVSHFLQLINKKIGDFFSWSTALLVITIMVDVIMRYVFSKSFIWVTELETYFFAISFMLAGGYAFANDKHVRVDLFYSKWSDRKKAIIDILGTVLFLLPWCIISIHVCSKYFYASFKIGESSAQAGGLAAIYLLKLIILLGFILLFIQAIAVILKSLTIVFSSHPSKS